MKIKLSDHFTYKRLIRYVLPSIIMMIFSSIYCVIDGLFISNFAGKDPFVAVNLIYPFFMILGAIGFMVGAGGSAIVSKTFGEKKDKLANEYFSFLIYFTFIIGIIFVIVGQLLLPNVIKIFKADDVLYPYCLTYGRIFLIGIPFFMLQIAFQTFFNVAEKPTLGFLITIFSGVMNIILDALLVAIIPLGIKGAALATIISQFVGAIIPIIYFIKAKNCILHLSKGPFRLKILVKTCSNGLSEFVSNISGSLVAIIFNYILLEKSGDNGVAAYGVLMYINFIFLAIFIGYSMGCAPLIGYNYGAKNTSEMKNLFKKSLIIIGISSIFMVMLAIILALPISLLFASYDKELFELTKRAFYIYSFSFGFSGFVIFFSSMFTALNNGIVSAFISFLRTLIFQISCVIIFSTLFGVDGIWISIVVAEFLSLFVALIFVFANKKRYQYA
ncbi:MAG: MATE family efflux transporter [Erysipelotrichaceae bacterium]|nr:MATE family efflux transporter [Erysipelotrichaceae bacterium]